MSEEVKPSLGEIMRRLDDLTMEVKQMNLNVSQTYLRKDVYDSDTERITQAMSHITDRLEKMESRSEWVIRTVGALFILSVVGASMYIGELIGF
jgi:tetrahydromethanopterin S-methyltransferase subunit G